MIGLTAATKSSILLLFSCLLSLYASAQPVIHSLAPASGPVGTTVTINGTGFSTDPASNTVYFGAVRAAVEAATETTLRVTVPVGATYQPVSVTANHLTAYSKLPFIVTFAAGNDPFTVATFFTKTDLTAGNYPHSVSLADFNQDGAADLLVSRGSSNTVSVFPNTGSGGSLSFAEKIDFAATGNNHEGAAVGDLDGDDKLDFVLTNSTGVHSVSAFRNISASGTVSFAPKLDLQVDNAPYTVAIGDIDCDGKPDLAIGNGGSNKVSLYKNTSTPGNISFGPRKDLVVGSAAYGVAISDLDGDGKPDLIITSQGSNSGLYIMRNISTGSFSFDAPVNYVSAPGFFTVSTGDLDGDGKPEVAAANAFSNAVVVLKNNSTPGSISFSHRQFNAGNYPVSVFIADLNGDGKPDLVTSNRFSNNVSALKNTSAVGALSFDAPVFWGAGAHPIYVAVGDLNGDSRPDIVAANSSAATVSVLAGLTETNTAPSVSSLSPASAPAGAAVTISGDNFSPTASENIVFFGAVKATVNSASATQLNVTVPAGATYLPVSLTVNGLTAYSAEPFMLTYQTDSAAISVASFSAATDYSVGAYPVAVSLADFNDDGKSDLVTVNGAGGSVSVLKNTSNAGITAFGPKLDLNTGPSPRRLAVGDLDGDGKLDIVVTNFNSGGAGSISVFHNISSGETISFAPGTRHDTGNGPIGVAIADMDLDGRADIIVSSGNSGIFSIFRNTTGSAGPISLAPKQDFPLLAHPDDLAVADLDRDGRPDLITSNFSNASISVFRNLSAGGSVSLAPRTDYATGLHSSYIAVGDLNGDGRLDVVVSNPWAGTVSFFRNNSISNSSISLGERQEYSLEAPNNVSLADLNGDGKLDLYTGRRLSGLVSVLENTSPGAGDFAFADKVDFTTGTYETSVAAGDLNGDGRPELVVANTLQNSISILENRFTKPVITGIADAGGIQFIKLFPNPVKDMLYLAWEAGNVSSLSMEIVDLGGRQVAGARNLHPGVATDLSRLPQGVYAVKVYKDLKLVRTMKILKL